MHHPGLKPNIPPKLFCMSWCNLTLSIRGGGAQGGEPSRSASLLRTLRLSNTCAHPCRRRRRRRVYRRRCCRRSCSCFQHNLCTPRDVSRTFVHTDACRLMLCRGTWDPPVPCPFCLSLPRLSPQNLCRILRLLPPPPPPPPPPPRLPLPLLPPLLLLLICSSAPLLLCPSAHRWRDERRNR